MKKNKELGEFLHSQLKVLIGPSAVGLSNRKNVAKNNLPSFDILAFNGNKYKVEISGVSAKIKLKNIECNIPFVPWDDIDEKYEAMSKELIAYDEKIIEDYKSRFHESY